MEHEINIVTNCFVINVQVVEETVCSLIKCTIGIGFTSFEIGEKFGLLLKKAMW